MKRNATANAKPRRTATAHVVESDDIPPMTAADLAKLRAVALSKRIRGEFKLSQEQFADRYGLSLATLRDWEQYRTEPDTAAVSSEGNCKGAQESCCSLTREAPMSRRR